MRVGRRPGSVGHGRDCTTGVAAHARWAPDAAAGRRGDRRLTVEDARRSGSPGGSIAHECRRSGPTASTSPTTSHGAGPPLVLLHGATSLGRERLRRPDPAVLEARSCCYLPDARGHGATRWDAADGFRYDWLVDDLAAFVDALGLETFHLVGFSMGAMTALEFALAAAGAAPDADVVGITTQREPRASRRCGG